jgi:hypothetical protein
MPDAIFAEPRLAQIYDAVDDDRSDLDAYLAMAMEFNAQRVLDVACGKPHAGKVRWLHTPAADLPATLQADLAFMTGNVAQVFVTDQDWATALAAARNALRPGGRLVFETDRDRVSFHTTFNFKNDGAVLTSQSTLRFRGRDQLTASLTAAGLLVHEVRDAPDRPGLEFVFITRRPGWHGSFPSRR